MAADSPQAEERYVVECKVGSGSYGVVYKVFDRITKTVRAAKVLQEEVWVPVDEPEEEEETTISGMALRELSFLKLLADAKTPCVTRLLDFCFELGEHCAPVVILTLFEGGDLSDAIEAGLLGRGERLSVGIDALTAVAHLHSFRPAILHRDIKPENVLLTAKKRGVLADFGFACFEAPAAPLEPPEERKLRLRRRRKGGSKNLSHSGVLGTLSYLAPEVLRRSDPRPSRDLWALGVLLLELGLNRRLDADSDAEAFREIRRLLEALKPPRGGGLLLEIVRSFLRTRPERRMEARDALMRLKRAGFTVSERLPQACPSGKPPQATRPPEVPEELRRLCQDVLETGVQETQEAAWLCSRLCPELEQRAAAAVAAKVYEHRPRSDEDMMARLGLSVEQLEEAQEALLVASGGCLLIPHLRGKLRTFPGH